MDRPPRDYATKRWHRAAVAHLDTAPTQDRGKRSAELRIGTNKRFPADLAESEFGAPGAVSRCVRLDAVQQMKSDVRAG